MLVIGSVTRSLFFEAGDITDDVVYGSDPVTGLGACQGRLKVHARRVAVMIGGGDDGLPAVIELTLQPRAVQ